MNSQNNPARPQYRYFQFGLLVTGKTEERHLPKLFTSLMEFGVCTFKVLARVPQLAPITSQQRKQKRTTIKKKISTKHVEHIAWPARKHLNKPDTYVLMVDDLEYHNREQPDGVSICMVLAVHEPSPDR